jgi:hypothetical protein
VGGLAFLGASANKTSYYQHGNPSIRLAKKSIMLIIFISI